MIFKSRSAAGKYFKTNILYCFMKSLYCCFLLCISLLTIHQAAAQQPAVYLDYTQPVPLRVNDLLKRLTIAEKISLLQFEQPAIPRLGIEKYNWWSEGLHGVARNGIATVFPQAIAMAATWDPALIQQEADIISTEARAKYRAEKEAHDIYQGLTFWSPNINIFRDPRWGRGQETYGEDPFLTAAMGVAFVKGMQGNDPHYLKVAATAKHFAVHSGPESLRHDFDVSPSDRDLYETYLPAFEALVKKAKVEAVMGAYNLFRGLPCNASPFLLDTILRKTWGFEGHIVSDCWALSDMVSPQKTYSSEPRAAASSLLAGLNITCGPEFGTLQKAIDSGWVTERQIDTALGYILSTRFRLGMFDPDSVVPYAAISPESNNTPSHSRVALQVARESMVLLKNEKGVLPFIFSGKTIAVMGALANDTSVLLGNYNGQPSAPVTILEGISGAAKGKNTILYASGTLKPWQKYISESELQDSIQQAVSVARHADVVIIVAGISAKLEGEEGDVADSVEGFYKGDRTKLDLPADQQRLIREIARLGKPVVLVLTNGSALSTAGIGGQVQGIVEAWYPGQQGGNAVADILFGRYNPAGRLPVTFYHSVSELPPFEEYDMKERTYRYFTGAPLYPFGYGLSYTHFRYADLQAAKVLDRNGSLRVSFLIENTGASDGDEVAQLYIRKVHANPGSPVQSLKGFKRIFIRKGATVRLEMILTSDELRSYDTGLGKYTVAPGKYEIMVGASSADIRLRRVVEIK